MPSGGSFIEGDEEDGEGDEAMESSSVPGGGGGGGGSPEAVLGDEGQFGPVIEGTPGGCEAAGQSDVGFACSHDGTDSPSNHSSPSTNELDHGKRSELQANPCTNHTESSGSEQPEQDRAQTHGEMMRAMREMKRRMPSERKGHRKTRTVEALHYALSCVKQVQASSKYHKLLLGSWKEEQRDVSPAVCSLAELESVTSEHTLKNTGTFVAVFSLSSGRLVYLSQQAPCILGLRASFLSSASFLELLYHQDINVFSSHTAQSRLPPWSTHPERKAERYECTWVKSFFCRLRGGKDSDGEVRYNPFRIAPYLLKVRGGEEEEEGKEEDQPCCLALAERIHSGYEAPRIPLEKRIFTTTHSPGCVFLEVDDRAVPLLGYLPQDLIGSSVLACLHPEDRPLMLALHHKILKYAGQRPFEYSPLRLRCQNGDYVTLDTSWSSFINPWSRKVAFIIGRHKVRTGPLNEEVFAMRSSKEQPAVLEEIQELQAQIYRLFLQPVCNTGSSGYGSMGSNGSHEPYISMSSSDSNGNLWEDSHREPRLCTDVRKVKAWGQRGRLDSQRKHLSMGRGTAAGATAPPSASQPVESGVALSSPHKDSRKQHHIPSYQQINCVDSIIRYLESYAAPSLKRKSESPPLLYSSSSEEAKAHRAAMAVEEAVQQQEEQVPGGLALTLAHSAGAVVGPPLTDITLSPEAMSVVSVTSQCSYSSTIVHAPQPESEVTALEDVPMGSEHADPTTPQPRPQFSPLGLTKEVLSAHTQKEEQEYVVRFRHQILRSPYRSYLQWDSSPGHSQKRGHHGDQEVGGAVRRKAKARELKAKRRCEQWSSDSYASPPEAHCVAPSPCRIGAPSISSATGVLPPYQQIPGVPNAPLYPGVPPYPGLQALPSGPGVLPVPGAGPYVAPVMAVMLPNFPSYPTYAPGAGPLAPTPPFLLPSVNLFGSSPFPAFPSPALVPQAPPTPAPPAPCPSPAAVDPLFSSSRSSSPLQLNLLQEELPKPAQPPEPQGGAQNQEEERRKEDEALSDSGNQDNQSTSSEVMDLLLQEDAHSRTGSNASGSGSGESGGSLGSGSNGTSTSNTGSGNSSMYFASDSSHTSPPASRGQPQGQQAAEDRANFEKCVENSLWSLIQHTPEPVMMTYQISPREQSQVLKEDRERLLLLAPMQPVFTKAQREELAEVHPWIKQHGLPQEINTQGCVTCKHASTSMAPPTAATPCPWDCQPLDANSPAPPTLSTPRPPDQPPGDASPDT